jgi:hypothetical protein
MIAISDPWVDDRRDKALLVSMPLTAGLVPILVSAHSGLLQIRLVASEDEAIARVLAEQALTLDSEHDERYRSLYAIVTGWAAVSSSEARRNMLEKLRDTLFPEGLAGTQRSYLAEAGNVELAVSKLTPEIEETLNSIIVDGRSVFQIFNEWVEVGRKLGEVERERARLSVKKSDDVFTAKDVLNARFFWIRAVNALSAVLDLESEVTNETRVRILQPLRSAEAKFARKRTAASSAEELDPTAEETDETSIEAVAQAQG